MNRPELYKKTVDILYDAYFNDTLHHTRCSACAVGNIVVANMGYKPAPGESHFWINKEGNLIQTEWYHVFVTNWRNGHQRLNPKNYEGDAKQQIDATGYKWEELAAIEKAFESTRTYDDDKEICMFNGLVAVLEVLKQIHEVEDNEPEVTRFKNHYVDKVSKL